MPYLLGSFLLITIVHGYILFTHRDNSNLTLSERAAEDQPSLLLYRLGHIVNGTLFTLFAYYFFVTKTNQVMLFWLAIAGVVTEWAQALIPAKGRYDRPHTAVAFLMSLMMTALGVFGAVLLPVDTGVRQLVLFITFVILWGYPLCVLLPRRYFWVIEMVNINLFYLQMFILLKTVML